MDFIDWCHHILQTLENERFEVLIDEHLISSFLFGEGFEHEQSVRDGVFQALEALTNAGLVSEEVGGWKITPFGRDVLDNPTEFWTEICKQKLDSEEARLLLLVNRLSPRQGANPGHAWLCEIGSNPILGEFNVVSPAKTNEQLRELRKYIYDLPELLEARGLLKTDARAGYYNDVRPTYQGLVWGTRRGFTIESNFIDELLREWETTTVEFKQELKLDTKAQKSELAKDVLGLATTKSSGRRFLIIGFNDKTRTYHAPPDETITQDRMEQVLANLTNPVVSIRYEIVDYRLGKVGKLEVIREPEKLPYRASKDVVIDAKGRKGLEKDKVYVRHGSHTEAPTDTELQLLKEEGKRAQKFS